MRRFVISLLLAILFIVTAALPVSAQEGSPGGCVIDIKPAVDALIDAQTASASGNRAAAVVALARAVMMVHDMQNSCGDSEQKPDTTPTAPVEVELPNTFTSDQALFTIDYPDGWKGTTETVSEGQGVSFSPLAGVSGLPGGVKPINIIVSTPISAARWTGMMDQNSLTDSTFAEGVDVIQTYQDLIEAGNSVIGTQDLIITPVTIADQRALEIRFSASPTENDSLLDIVFYVVELDPGAFYGMVVGVTPTGELSTLEPIVTAMAKSLKLQ